MKRRRRIPKGEVLRTAHWHRCALCCRLARRLLCLGRHHGPGGTYPDVCEACTHELAGKEASMP